MKRKTVVLRIDLYTQIILTVIAVALVGSLLRPILSPTDVVAQGFVQDVNIASIGGKDPKAAGPIRVHVTKAETVPVNIKTPQLLPVQIVSAATALRVEITDSVLLPGSVEEPDVVPVGIVTRDPVPMAIVEPAVFPVTLTQTDPVSVGIVESVRLSVDVAGPLPVPTVETNIRSWAPEGRYDRRGE
jgi:hypothetical protein